MWVNSAFLRSLELCPEKLVFLFFFFFLILKISWEKPEVVYLKIAALNFQVNIFRAHFSGGWPVLACQRFLSLL